MPRKKTRKNFIFDSETCKDLLDVQSAVRATSEAAAVLWALRFSAHCLRMVQSGQILLTSSSGKLTVLDVPGHPPDAASRAGAA